MTASVDTRIEIITSNRKYPLIWWCELPDKWKKEYPEEDYGDSEFVIYRDWCYLVADFCITNNVPEFKGWDGYMSDSFFSGVLIKYVKDDDNHVIMGRYYS